jgi:hypothetical protein
MMNSSYPVKIKTARAISFELLRVPIQDGRMHAFSGQLRLGTRFPLDKTRGTFRLLPGYLSWFFALCQKFLLGTSVTASLMV